jgi:site-specific DNA-cytosine methylase
MPDNVDKLFEIMQTKGAASDRDKFRKVFLTPGNKGYKIRKDIYDGLRADGIIDSPTYEDFRRKLRLGGTPIVNKYHQQMLNSVDPNKSRASEFTRKAVGQAVRATNNARKPVTAKVVNQKGKPTGEEFAITPAKTVEDLDREYAQEITKNWENELHDQMDDADKDAAKISEMFKSFIGSTDEVGSVWGNMTRGGGIAGTPHSVTTNNGILENTEARQILAAGDYNRKRRELLQLEQDSRNGAIFDNHSFWRGMYDAAKDTGFLTGGASDLINAGSLLATKQDLDNGVHTEAGDMLMQQAVKNSDAQSQYGDNQGWMYTGGVITTNMAPFMIQIGSAGFSKGMSTSIGKVVQGAASKVALGTMKKAAGYVSADLAKNIGKFTGLTTKAFGKAVQYGIVGAAQANTVGLGNVANDVINRYTGHVYQDEQGNYKFGTFDSDGKLVHEGGEDFLTALVKGEAAQTIEFATELAGGGIDAVGTALKNFVTKGGKKIIKKYNMENVSKVIDFLLNNKVSKNVRYLKDGADRTLGKVEVNSIVGESLEEELGIIANTVFTGDNKISDLWDEKQQSQIWGGMLLSIGLMKGVAAPFHAYNAKQYYSYKHKLDKADVNLSQLLGKEKWEELRNQIDATTNDDMPEMINKINRDVALGKNRQPVREYIQNLLIMRGYDIGNVLAAKKAIEDKGEGVSVKNMEKNQAYQQGRDAYGYDTHEIQLDQEDKQKSLAQLLGISEQQLASMSDEELDGLSGRDDNIDRAIYDYQLSNIRYQGVIDNAQDQIDLAAQKAAQAVDMYTDKSRNTIRNATVKATGGLEDYGVYIINGNIATHDDGSIDVSNSDDMILYYDPTTNSVEHADALMFAELGEELPADDVKAQAVADAKEIAIKEVAGIIDGTVDVGSQFLVTDADGTEHTYEVLADYGDGTAAISIDGNVVENPYSLADLQQMKDLEDKKRLEAAKAQREQMEKERAEQQKQAQTEETQPSLDFNQILNDNGNVVIVDVIGKDGNTKYPNSKLFLIRDSGAKAKVVELKSDGTIVPHAVNKKDVRTTPPMSLDEYKQAVLGSSMIEENSGENRGEIEVETPTIEDAEPIGTGAFGNIYNQFKGKVKEAFNFLMHHKSGDLLGVFHRDDVGDIDLVWGNEKMGLAHILGKHVGEGKDFETPDDAIAIIENVINSGRIFQNNDNRYTLMLDGVGVGIRKSFDGEKKNWIVTAVDFNRSQEEKGIVTNPTSTSHGVTESESAAALNDSDGKDINNSSNGNENNESLTFEDGTPIPVDVNGEVDLSQTDAAHAAEWYDTNLGDDADGWLDGEIKKAKKVLEQAMNKKLTGTKPSELVASKKEKEAAIADAQAHYDSAISIRDALKERQIAKLEDTPEGRKNLIEKARRKFARLKSAVKNDAEAVAQIYKETIGTLLHRLYDGTGIDVTDTIPLTAEEYVASNLGAHSLNYEGTETSKGVKQETGLSREDFAKTQLLAADGKGTTIDNLVHSLWENRPSNLESLDTQEIRNALIDVLTSGFKASETRNYIENLRIAQAENILEEQKKAAENAAYAEEQKAMQEEEKAKQEEEKKAEEKTHSEAFNKIVDLAKKQEEILDNPDNVKEYDKINREIDELLKTLSDEEFKEVSDALLNIDEDFEYLTADEYERREGVEESKKAKAYNESLQQTIKQIAPYSDALKAAVKSGDKKAIANAQKELTDALLASTLGHGYLSSQLAQAKMAKKKDETYSENRAFIKPLTDAINAIESALDSAIADAGLEGVHVDFKDNGHGWIYADKGSEWSSRLKPLDNNYRNVSQYDGVNPASVLPQITMDNVEKVAGIIKSRIEEGERYNSDEYNDEENEKINDNINENINSPEQTKFPDKLREGSDTIEVPEDATDDKPLGKQLSKDKVPFKVEGKNSGEMYDINDNEDRQRLINDNKVDDKDILDIDMPEHVHKAIKELCKKMGLKVQFLYMGANLNGWVENGTMYLALDAKNAIQCVFGHEMTHAIKQKNPEAYKELVKVALAVTTKKEFEEDLAKVYQSYHGYKGYNNVDDFVEEVVADNIGKFINDYDLAKKFSLRLNHPVLATIIHAIQKIKGLLYGDFYKSVDALERIVEKAYVETANGQVTNTETGEDVSFSLRQKPEPKKKGIGYKVFVLKDGKLYPPMVANPDGAATPVGVWLDADAAPIAGESKTGRPQVKQGGKGTQGGSGKLAYRPGWHLGVVPYAIQFNRKDAEGNKTLFPKNFVFAEVEYAADVDYQEEARQEGINPSGKYQHSLAGLKHLPTDGYYMYRTNPNPETDPWVITGAMKVNRILTRAEQAELVKNAGREPQQIQEGDIVTDDVVNSINQEIADAPKFSIKTYHGSQASFDHFDHSFMGSGEGAQAYGWGTYVSEVEGIAKAYAKANAKKNAPSRLMYQGKPMTYKTPSIIYQVALDMDKFNISAKEAISKMIDANEKKLASVGDTPFAKMRAKQVQDELKVLKDLNPSDFKINEDYDTVAQDLVDTKSGLDLLEDELKDAKSYVDLYQSRLDEAKEELSKAKESGTGLGVDMYESDVEYYSEQVKRYKQSIKTKESDIKDVKTKVDALQKKLDSMEKPRNLYSVDIPDDTGDNYLGWDEPLNAKQIDMWKKALLSAVPESDRAYYEEWADGMLENRKKENNPLTGKDAYYAIDSKYASKKTSMALSKAGFVGVKVIAQRNTGGNKEGKVNYVVFDENNAQITSHTKFSLKKDGLTPEIANTPVNIVDADEEHGFKNYAEAREWAKKNIVRTYNDEETGGKGEINISNTAVGKYLSEKAVKKSANKDVHMSVLKVLPSILRESVDAIQHVDRNKVGNERSEDFGVNPDVMIHRCYGAVNIGDKVYGVKITLKENVRTHEKTKLYSYEATKIELLDGQSGDVAMTSPRNSNNSITVAKIIKGFETTKKNGEKFSLKDEKTLAGVHNITEEKLRKALKLGGFANPSLAVIDTNKTGHDNFGEISFIAPSALLDKRTGKTGGTWITDAYTQRYPSVEREMSEKGYRKFEDWVDSLDYPSGAKAEIERQAKDALSDNNAPAWELMYLKEKGIDIKEYDSNINDYRWKEIIRDHPTAEDILNSMKTDPELNEKVTSLAKYAIIRPTMDKISLEVRRKIYEETGVKKSPISPIVRQQTKEIFERDYKSTLLNKDGSPRKKDVKKVVEDIVKEHNDTKKYDFYLSKVKASNYVNKNGLYDDYIRWQENKLDEFGTKNRIFRGYTKDGSRKYVPETLENVSKVMREEADGQTNGSEYTSFGSFIAKLASRVDSTDEMRANKDKLSSNKDKEEFYEKWSEVYYDLAKFLYNDVFYGEQRLHDIVLQSDPKKYAKKEYGIILTPTFMKKLDALKNAVQTELKSAYFETKYNRPLRLNEFAAAVVPDNLGEDVRKGIENAGLPMYDYDPNKEGDRSRAFNEAINSSDNIRFSLAGERGAAAADKAEERTFRMDNLSVARKMEEEKKDAKAIKMATGWERGADGKWRYEMPDAKIKDTMDVGGGHIVKRYEDDMLWNGGKLSNAIDAPELFKAYPQLKDVRIDTDAIMNDMSSNGEYNSKTNTITIHADELKYMNDILNHEIQHAIQGIEGFATGGSPTTIRGEVKKRFDEVTKQIKQLRAEGKEDEAKALIEKNRGLYNAYMKNDDFDSYKSLAGEVEARNVQERMNMTPEERRKSLAESTEDVARKDQIFLGVGDVSFSLRDMADGKESGAADMAEDLKGLNTPDEVDDAIKSAIEDMPSGWQMANKKMIHIAQALGENRKAEIAGEESKFSLKDGTLIKAGTYFSGGGLVEEGLKGIIDPVVAVEYDEKISGVYRNNFGQHIVTADVRDVDPKELVKQIDGEVEYFHASPVCKNYSQAKSNHAEVELDKETAASTAEFINAVKPKVVTIENVKGYKDSDAMKIITVSLDANGYNWDADVYNAADYGGYSNRERLIVRAVRDGKLPAKPKKMARKSGWYEAVADIIPTLTEKKNGVAPWMDIRLKADGIDWRNIDKPLYVMGSAYADGKIPHAFADELLPTLRTKSGDVIVMPDGKVYRAMGRVLARVSGVSDDYKMPFSENLSHTIIGNGIPTQLTEHVIAPLLTGSDPKFSIRTYHGTGSSFDKFDFSHMGEGEGSQAFGWGGYVTNSKEIAEDYTRRAKMRKNNGGFEFVTDLSDSNKDMVRHYIYKYKDVDKGLDAMRKDLSSALEMFPDDDNLKELSDILAKKNEEIAVPDDIAYLYDVDIPDDNGDYLDWENKLKKSHLNKVNKELVRIGKEPIEAIYPSRVDGKVRGQDLYDELSSMLGSKEAASKLLSDAGFVGIKYPAGTIFGGAKKDDYNYVIFDENNANIVGNTRFSLRYDQFEHDLNQWKKDNNLPKDAQRPTIPQRNAGESAVDFLKRVDEYRKQMALWKTAPTYEQHLLSDDTALGEFNRELQRGSVLKRIAFQDSMLAIRKAQEAIMKEVGVDRLNMAEDAYTAENRSHGKGKNEFEEYNNEFLQPLRKAYHQMKKILGDSYDNVRIYMMAKHGLERDAQMAFKKSLDADFEDVAQRSAAYRAYKGDMNRITNDSDLEFGRVDFNTWRQRDNALRTKYSPSYMDYRYDENGIAYDYSGLSALFGGSDFEEAAHKLVRDIESSHVAEVQDLWNATNAATKKILRDGYKAGMMSKDTYLYVRDMYSHYIPLRGWDGTTADQVWDYVGGGKGAFNQTLKTAHGRTSIADDPIAYIENMAESGILLNNKNWVKQHLMLLAQNHPTSLLTLSKAWYVKSTDANGNEEWIPATPQITSQMNSNQVKATIDAFEQKMENMAQTGDATQQREGLNIAYPQTHSEEREHEVRVMKDGEEYVIYVNGDPQLAQAMNNTRAHRVREIQSGKLDRAAAWLGRKMAAAYTSLSPLFIPSNYFRDLTMTLASTAIREDGRYNYLLRKNLATSWNLGFMLRDYQNGKLRDKVNNGNATPKEQMFYDFMMNGGETGFVSSLDVEDLKKKFKNDLKDLDRWKANPVKVGHTIMDSIEFLNRMIEDSNRFAVYMTSIQYGRSIDEAVNDAKDVTLNFNRKGTGEYGWQMIRNLYLFINPAVQSLQTLGALAKHHPFKFTAVTASWLASGVLVPIVNAALMSLLGGDDDKDKYWQFTKWDRRNNLIMWVPFTHEYVKIPLAQEFRAFYGVGDMIASKMMGGELAEESWSQYAEDLLGQVVDMLPLDPTGYDGNIAVSLMPNAIRPVFELAFNVDFTGKPLFKETEYNKYDPNFTKAYVGTPDWLVRASKMVNSIGNDYPDVQQNSIDAFGDPRYNLNNPAVVDHVLSSYLGGAYTMGSQVLGLLTKSLNDRKEIKVADIPLVSKFVSNPDDRPVSKKQGDEFWDKKEYYDRASNTISKLKKQAKIDGDYSQLERFYGSEEYKTYKLYEKDVKDYKEARKKERAEESGDEYRPHQLNAEDIYNNHATPMDEFEDMKLK